MKNQKILRRKEKLFRSIEDVVRNKSFGKGRESFVMLLGQYGGSGHVAVLRELLGDDQVNGHAVYSFRLLGAEEAKEGIRPFLESDKTWVRNEAKKYFRKIER